MATIVTPSGSETYIDPYNSKLFDLNISDSRVYLSKQVNNLLKLFGDNVVTHNLKPTTNSNVVSNTLTIEIDAGSAIIDTTLHIFPDVIELTADLTAEAAYSSNGYWIVTLNYKYVQSITANKPYFKIFHIADADMTYDPLNESYTIHSDAVYTPNNWIDNRDNLVIAIFDYVALTSITQVAAGSSLIVNGNTYRVNVRPELNANYLASLPIQETLTPLNGGVLTWNETDGEWQARAQEPGFIVSKIEPSLSSHGSINIGNVWMVDLEPGDPAWTQVTDAFYAYKKTTLKLTAIDIGNGTINGQLVDGVTLDGVWVEIPYALRERILYPYIDNINPTKIRINPAIQIDPTDDSFLGVISDKQISPFNGALIDFEAGTIKNYDQGSGDIDETFTPYNPGLTDRWFKYGILLDSQHKIALTIPTNDAATLETATNPTMYGGIPLCSVAIESSDGIGGIEDIQDANITRFASTGTGSSDNELTYTYEDELYSSLLQSSFYGNCYKDTFHDTGTVSISSEGAVPNPDAVHITANNSYRCDDVDGYIYLKLLDNNSFSISRFLLHVEGDDDFLANMTFQISTEDVVPSWGTEFTIANLNTDVDIGSATDNLWLRINFNILGSEIYSFGVLYGSDTKQSASSVRLFETITISGYGGSGNHQETIPNGGLITYDGKSASIYPVSIAAETDVRGRLIEGVHYTEIDGATIEFIDTDLNFANGDQFVIIEHYGYVDSSWENYFRINYQHDVRGLHIFKDETSGIYYELYLDNNVWEQRPYIPEMFDSPLNEYQQTAEVAAINERINNVTPIVTTVLAADQYQILASDACIHLNFTATPWTAYLPPVADSINRRYIIKNISDPGVLMYLNINSGDTTSYFEGESPTQQLLLPQYASYAVISNGTHWYVETTTVVIAVPTPHDLNGSEHTAFIADENNLLSFDASGKIKNSAITADATTLNAAASEKNIIQIDDDGNLSSADLTAAASKYNIIQVNDVGSLSTIAIDTENGILQTDVNGNITSSTVLADGTTTTSQSIGDNTQKLATDEFVISNAVQRSEWLQTGFIDNNDSILSFDDVSRVFTINRAGTSFEYYIAGTLYSITTDDVADVNTITLTDTEGFWVIYYDNTTLTSLINPTVDQYNTILVTKCIIGFVYYDASNNKGILCDLRYGFNMTPSTRKYLYNTIDMEYVSGLALDDFVLGDGSLDSHAQFSINSGVCYNQDLILNYNAINSTTGLNIFYSESGSWRWTTQAGFKCMTFDGTSSTRLAYNDNGTLTEAAENNFVCVHIFTTNTYDRNPVIILGQAEYGSLGEARDNAINEIHSIRHNFPVGLGYKQIATAIFQTSLTYTNTVNAKLVTTDSIGSYYIDWRTDYIKTVTFISTTVTVAKTGREFTSIQDAIDSISDASSSKIYVVHIFPGVYTETIIGKDYVNLEGQGLSESIQITSTTGPVYTAPNYAGSCKNINFILNTTTDNQSIIYIPSSKTGDIAFLNCNFTTYISGDAGSTIFNIDAGNKVYITNSFFNYTQTGSTGSAAKTHELFNISGSSATDLYNNIGTVIITDVDDNFNLVSNSSSGDYNIFGNTFTINNTSGTSTGITIFLNKTVNSIISFIHSNNISLISSGGGTAIGYYLNSLAGGIQVRSTANRIYITGFTNNYISNIDTGDLLISQADDITATNRSIGTGIFKYSSSFANGSLDITDQLIIGDGTTNYTKVGSTGDITLYGTARKIKSIHIYPLLMDITGAGTADAGFVSATPVRFFADAAIENIRSSIVIPGDIDLTVNPILRIHAAPYVAQSTGSAVVWRSENRYIGSGESINKAIDQTVSSTMTVSNTALIRTYTDITLNASLMAINDLVSLYFYRDGPDAADNRNGDIALIELEFRYTSNKLGD